jgi:hypothetical protein
MTKELNLIIQGNYGQGWEDVSYYPCGYRRKNYRQAYKECKHDLAEYRLMGYSHRVIERYEELEEE